MTEKNKIGALAKMDISAELDKKIESFKSLLDGIDSLSDKRKELWKEIYENALIDRRLAYDMFDSLYPKMLADPDQHAIHGPSISKYLERMSKSNDQIIKLSELISEAVTSDEAITSDDIYAKIGLSAK